MCTVSWTRRHDGYDLFFNRDERKTRAAELPPALARRAGVAFVAPWDGERGGTWLAANEFGITVALLNDYAATWRPAFGVESNSRGHIVTSCAMATSRAEVLRILRMQPLARTPAFRLAALSRDETPLVVSWADGVLRYEDGAAAPFLSSSSFATNEVVAYRRARFDAVANAAPEGTLAELARLHYEHDRARGAHSVLMHRSDASTRSVTHVSVAAEGVQLRYQPVQWIDGRVAPGRSAKLFLPGRGPAVLAA